ncbi:hypothetical protein N7495_003189 [Penicillium taxi]|uniref:uncharacterized protein n=1 Tax=Penicillium taxi TaxID=168475 RepID=UPI0025454A55|nr:uncharacterized protein N7495_003189 [Penicillium taxi]KAJ5902661.1 hypothetical protein N7495_003189 [Penicillium taxi]
MDAYSRCITWVYIGVKNRTEGSILCQHANTVAQINFQPRIICARQESETTALINAHVTIRKASEPNISPDECFRYIQDADNKKIKYWWTQLSKSSTFVWYRYFQRLQSEGLFSESIPEQVALLAVYMPSIRSSIKCFVGTTNQHHSRPRTENAIAGKPFYNYTCPADGIEDYKLTVDKTHLRGLQQHVESWDVDKYLPSETMVWCLGHFQEMGFDPLDMRRDSLDQPFRNIYLELRQRALNHYNAGAYPVLSLCSEPTSVSEWAL